MFPGHVRSQSALPCQHSAKAEAGNATDNNPTRIAIEHEYTGATLDIAQDGSDHYIGEAGGYRLHLIYRADAGFMRSDEAMLDMATAERIAAAGKASGKPILLFAAGKYMGQKQLTAMGLTFCQLPYAIHRMLPGDGDGE